MSVSNDTVEVAMNSKDIIEEEFKRVVRGELRKVYFAGFRGGFLSCLAGALLFYTLFI